MRPILSNWPSFDRIDWSGSANSFANRLIYALPEPELQGVLRRLDSRLDPARIEPLRRGIDEIVSLKKTAATTPTGRHYLKRVTELSKPSYQVDRRFVNLTLLLDQGPEATGMRFIADDRHPKYTSLDALLAEIDERAAVLLGKPGSGKSTLLRRLELERAWQALEARADSDDGPMPFFVSLGSFRAERPEDPPQAPSQWLAEEWALRRPDFEPFDAYLRKGRLLLLLDGLNEIPHLDPADYEARLEQWRTFLLRVVACDNTVVFSCRSLYSALVGSGDAPVRQVIVEPLSEEQIEAFLQAHLGRQGATVWAALREDEDQVDLFSTPFYLRLLVDQIGPRGEIPPGRAALLTGFVRRALRREIEEHDQRLLAAGPLLSADDRRQIVHGPWADRYQLPPDGPLIPALQMLAYRMQDGRRTGEAGGVRVPEQTARKLLADPWVGDPAPDAVLAAGLHLGVLDKDLATREIFFFHQLFQEYFAAREVAHVPEPERLSAPWRADEIAPSLAEKRASLKMSEPLLPLPATGWEETTLMAAAMATDQAAFVTRHMEPNLPLAARCAAAPEVAVSRGLTEALQAALLARVADPAADPRARIDAAEALGELGDPRFERRTGPHGDYLLPPLAPIPAGTYTIGDDEGLYDDEKPAHAAPVAAFEIGVFPLTNAEYRLFIRASGYKDERWWDTEAAKAWRSKGGVEGQRAAYRDRADELRAFSDDQIRAWSNTTSEQKDDFIWFKNLMSDELERLLEEWFPSGTIYHQPEFWDNSRFNHQARPVVGLTWFEARAYCAWLSAQTGDAYGLPSEVEWEAAARGLEGRAYAYGAAFDVEAGNTFESHIRRTTPVGVFPTGRTPEGVTDLSGNVWEWTTTIYRSYDDETGDREDPEDAAARRVARGGSWNDGQYFARAAFRYHDRPLSRLKHVGCRLVRRPPSQAL